MQEFNAAKKAILSHFPTAVVNSKRKTGNDMLVSITTEGQVVWSGDQRGLFQKNNHRALPEINEKLSEIKK
jgi:hypothetical protein